MNERIKQLALQAGYLPDMFGVGHWDMPEFHKFSELLVHECVSIVENLSPGYNDYRNQIEDAFRHAAISEMKYILLGEKNE
jgi:hypothetical protein